MHILETLLQKAIAAGLKRTTIDKTSSWSMMYRKMGPPFPGDWTFDHHPWLFEMSDCETELMIGQKAAQMGYTECAMNKAFKKIDIDKMNVVYVLPATHPDATDFSNGRFDPALDLSKHLDEIFSDTRNTGLKRAGHACLYVRGSRSRGQMKSLPAGFMIFDEVEEMNLANVELAFERMSGQFTRQAFMLSTPRFENIGINAYFKNSSQKHYFFKCPHCSRMTEFTKECLIITAESIHDPRLRDSYLQCKECKTKLPHEEKPNFINLDNCQWIPKYKGRIIEGYHIPQAYSHVLPPWKIAESTIKATTDPYAEQELYNSKWGITHEVDGSRVLDEHIEKAKGGYRRNLDIISKPMLPGLYTLGADVGQKFIHFEIDKWTLSKDASSLGTDINSLAHCQLIREGKVKSFEELGQFLKDYRIRYACVDSEPERRLALQFAQRYDGMVKLIKYTRGITGKTIRDAKDDSEYLVHVDRTSWLDLALGRIIHGNMSLPIDVTKEWRDHIKALVRAYIKDADGNEVGKYVKGENDPDHYAHARNYSELALYFAISLDENRDIT